MSPFVNPFTPSTTTPESQASQAHGRYPSQGITVSEGGPVSFPGYTSRDSTYYRMMEGPNVNVHMWYVIIRGMRVGIVKDVYAQPQYFADLGQS